MKKFFSVLPILLITLCFSFGAYAATVSETAGKAPSAYFPENTYSFAPVVEGAEVTHDFRLVNKGSGPLKIEKVSTG